MHAVYDQAFGAKMPTYNTVLQLDRKLRGFPVPQLLQIAGFGSTDSRMGTSFDSVPLILQRHLVLAIRESSTSSVACLRRWLLTVLPTPDLLCMCLAPDCRGRLTDVPFLTGYRYAQGVLCEGDK